MSVYGCEFWMAFYLCLHHGTFNSPWASSLQLSPQAQWCHFHRPELWLRQQTLRKRERWKYNSWWHTDFSCPTFMNMKSCVQLHGKPRGEIHYTISTTVTESIQTHPTQIKKEFITYNPDKHIPPSAYRDMSVHWPVSAERQVSEGQRTQMEILSDTRYWKSILS